MQDLRDAFRAFRSSPIVSAVAIFSLALGIGANTAIFSILDSLTLRTLPVEQPAQLSTIRMGDGDTSFTNPLWEQIRARETLVEGALAWSPARFNLAQSGETEMIDGIWASGGYFGVLGVSALLGRTLDPDDDRRGGGTDGPVAVISYGFWQRRYAGAADVVGRSLTIERVPFTVVGVTGPGFFGTEVGRTFDVAVPLGAAPGGVVRLVLTRVALLVGLGIVLGVGLAFMTAVLAAKTLATLLYGLQPPDPITFSLAALILAGVGALAGWIPARRASRIDPALVLRQ